MTDRGRVIIIPNENKILQSIYEKDIMQNHLEAFRDFSEKFKLGYHFKDEDYQEAPLQIAKEGHLSIKTIDDAGLFIIYIPRVVTDRQIEWFYKNMDNYNQYQTIGGFAIETEEPQLVEGKEAIKKIMNKRNMLYMKEEEDKNVRKEI